MQHKRITSKSKLYMVKLMLVGRKIMSLKFCSFASGSRGNSYLVKSDEAAIIVDAGISGKKIFNGLEMSGTDLLEIKGVLVTHEHTDHAKSLKILMKKAVNAILYCNIGTWQKIKDLVPDDRQVTILTGDQFEIGDIEVKSFKVHHDAAEPVGYTFTNKSKILSIITDTGHICQNIFGEIRDADLLVLEANHEPRVLEMGSYPYSVKQRILGDLGHLSNEAAGDCLCNLIDYDAKDRRILLAHLSQENNTPDLAAMTVKNALANKGRGLPVQIRVEVIVQNTVSPLFEV